MLEDGDAILRLVGVVLVVGVLVGVGIVAISIGAGPIGEGAPDANFTIERVNGSYVQVTHTGGEPVSASNLVVTVDSLRRETRWTGVLAEGDSTLVRAGTSSLVRVNWDGGRAEKAVLEKRRL